MLSKQAVLIMGLINIIIKMDGIRTHQGIYGLLVLEKTKSTPFLEVKFLAENPCEVLKN